ncbi:GNAT family N-acetyltransferase [Microscilla marina]|uniref:Acetyltransferase, gnat family n=1 Tax=Microscilla marina ATCC 23134 TaxID=313606 RepID=A1ZPY3_MICM2|nr:GNAT family N-acetyltransferase [Microscilla marina]EAY27638.1 acetyltransferase, gnat family [Microscilla marina ATCC 23134]
MKQLVYTTLHGPQEIKQLLALQQRNLPVNISTSEAHEQGFVTVEHDFELMQAMNSTEAHIIAKDGDTVVGYCLVMLESFQDRIPVLQPMFDLFGNLSYRQKPLSDYCFFVMGQVCIDKAYRGQGVFDGMYAQLGQVYGSKYDFVVTEVATRNQRSIKAHARVGFQLLHQYTDPRGEAWDIILWDF